MGLFNSIYSTQFSVIGVKMGIYYGAHEEKLVQEYLDTHNAQLFEEEIYPLLQAVAYGVCGGKQFNPVSFYRSRTIIDGCVSHLWECLRYKYDKNKGRTFSYLSACAFHYFCGVARTYKKSTKTLFFVGQEMEQHWINMHRSLYMGSVDEVELIERESVYYNNLIPALEAAAAEMGAGRSSKDATEGVVQVMRDVKHLDETALYKKALYKVIRQHGQVTTKQIAWTLKAYLRPLYRKVQKENNY